MIAVSLICISNNVIIMHLLQLMSNCRAIENNQQLEDLPADFLTNIPQLQTL